MKEHMYLQLLLVLRGRIFEADFSLDIRIYVI